MATSVISTARAILVAAIPGVQVVQTFAGTPAKRAIRLSRVGGGRSRELDRPRILVECYASTAVGAPDGPQAEQDCYAAAEALRLAASGGPWAGSWVTCWETNNIVDFFDPSQTKHARWQLLGDLYVLTHN